MGFTGAHMLYYVLDIFILALYLLSHVCALLEYTFDLMHCRYVSIMSSGLCPNCEECTFPGCGEDPNFHYGVNRLEDREVLASE